MKRNLIVGLVAVVSIFIAFQNCGRVDTAEEVPAVNKPFGSAGQEVVKGTFNGVSKVEFNLASLDGSNHRSTGYSHTLDLAQSNLIDNAQQKVVCQIPTALKEKMSAVLHSAQFCEPFVPPDAMLCQAIGLPYVKIHSGSSVTELRPYICMNGLDFCGDKKAEFKTALLEMVEDFKKNCASSL